MTIQTLNDPEANDLMSALKIDILRFREGEEGGWYRKLDACLRSAGLHAVVVYRFGHWIFRHGLWANLFFLPIYLLFNYRMKSRWGITIDRGAAIGEGLVIYHYGSIFVGKVVIGKNCTLTHEVTIGLSGSGYRDGLPTIGDNVTISPGAKLVGKIRIGHNVIIGPNSVVLRDIPDNARVAAEGLRFVVMPPRRNASSPGA